MCAGGLHNPYPVDTGGEGVCMESDDWLDALDERLADRLRFLVEIDRLKGVVRANRVADGAPAPWRAAETVFADAVERGWLRAAPR